MRGSGRRAAGSRRPGAPCVPGSGEPSPAERLLAAIGGAGADRAALPERLSVFGLSALSGPAAAALVEAARTSDVLVLATTASQAAVRDAVATESRGSGARDLIVAPERLTPGNIAVHWTRPIAKAVPKGISSTVWKRTIFTTRSNNNMMMPPTINAMATISGVCIAVRMAS